LGGFYYRTTSCIAVIPCYTKTIYIITGSITLNTPTKPNFQLPEDFDWTESLLHLELLCRFLEPFNIDFLSDDYNTRLGESLRTAITRFQQSRSIVRCSPEECLDIEFSRPSLVDIFEEPAIKSSETKKHMIARLVKAHPSKARQVASNYWKLSNKGRRLTQQYIQDRRDAQQETMQRTYDCFLLGDNKSAIRIYTEYFEKFSRHSVTANNAVLQSHVLSSQPGALQYISIENLSMLRAGVCMSLLWNIQDGEEMQWTWIPAHPLLCKDVVNNEMAANFLLCSAKVAFEKTELRKRFAFVYATTNSQPIGICELCQSVNHKVLRVSDIPDLPLPGCESRSGCHFKLDTSWQALQRKEGDYEDTPGMRDKISQFRILKEMLDNNYITQEDYDRHKAIMLKWIY
jgi:hypothetical protein